MMTHRKAIEFSYVFLLLLLASSAFCQETLRIMTYNLLNYVATDQSRDVYHRTVIDAADPDVLVVQEMTSQTAVNNFLNNVANFTTAGKYVAGSFNDGPDTDNAIYIKPSKVSVVRNLPIRTALRDINEFMLVHTVSSETLRVYSVHLKASSGSSNEAARAAEVDNLRAVTNALLAGSNFIVVGDFNIYNRTNLRIKS